MIFKPFFRYCIYCDKELPDPEKRTGNGEHIIPRNIYGFWKSRDVCEDCIKYFNEKVDDLPLQNLEIIGAVKTLGLDSKKVFDNNLKYEGIDLYNEQRVDFITKRGKPVIKSVSTELYSQYKEDDFYTLGINDIRKSRKKHIPKDKLEQELESLKEKYKNVEYGGIVHSDFLKVTIRKSTARTKGIDKSNLKLLAPLIAKIDIAALFMFIPVVELKKIKEIDILRNYLRFNGNLPEFLITYLPMFKEVEYNKFHLLRVRFFDSLLLLDVCLFGYPTWKTSLHLTEPIIYKPLPEEPDLVFDEFRFVLDFEDLNTRKFHLYYKNTKTNDERDFESK